MKVLVIYCYPQLQRRTYYPLARRFAATWRDYPPGADCQLHVICNEGDGIMDATAFGKLDRVTHLRDNSGWDIGAFFWAARHLSADLMVFLGAPVHFHRRGWLWALVDAYVNNGPGVYGCWSYQGHLRTTAFACPPALLLRYPDEVTSERPSRYRFEHGEHSFTRFCSDLGFLCRLVSWDGCFEPKDWSEHAPGIGNSLVYDQHIHPS